MRAGTMRHRVTIQKNTQTRDAYGATIDGWADVDTVWAAIEPRTGREAFAQGAGQVYAETSVDIRMRYRTDLKPAMRVKCGDDIYNIQSVMNRWGRDIETFLQCTVAE